MSGDGFEVDLQALDGLAGDLKGISDRVAALKVSAAGVDGALPGARTAAAVGEIPDAVGALMRSRGERLEELAVTARGCGASYREVDDSGASLLRQVLARMAGGSC